MPSVSIVMPVYNASLFLKESIDGVLNQLYTDFELILINDGSTDSSLDIIKQYKDERIKYFDQSNKGVAITLNRGIELSTGKYVWRHDADDISLKEKLKLQVEFLESNPDISLCACQVAFMSENSKVAWDFRQPHSSFFHGENYKIVTRQDFSPYSPITHGTVLMKSEVVRKLGGYRPEFLTGEDVDLWLRMIVSHKAVVLNQCLSFHRLSQASATQIHGWKNEFFRNLAFKFYDQRIQKGLDDLDNGLQIVVPTYIPVEEKKPGMTHRKDLLLFRVPLYINARDYFEVINALLVSVKCGWRLSIVWKQIFIILMGPTLTQQLVKFKKSVKAIFN